MVFAPDRMQRLDRKYQHIVNAIRKGKAAKRPCPFLQQCGLDGDHEEKQTKQLHKSFGNVSRDVSCEAEAAVSGKKL